MLRVMTIWAMLAATAGAYGGAIVMVDGGAIRGTATEDGAVAIYRGVPYAAPPVGELRWRPPQPVEPWEGVRDCSSFAPACPQPPSAIDIYPTPAEQSEDCLYLNIYAPAHPQEPLPVMVWIHGGGCTTGSGSLAVYNGERLARLGVVVVTINYRLGPLGFLAHPLLSAESPQGVSGNYGMLDQIAALQWVQRNIVRFGGDPDRVTIFGESAGGASVARLLVSPLAAGLFHRAIAQSGAARGHNRHLREEYAGLPPMEQVGEELFAVLGCDRAPDPLAAARLIPPERLIKAADPQVGLLGSGTKYGWVVDGWALPDDPEVLLAAGKMHLVPVMAGSNADDGSVFADRVPVRTPTGYRLLVRRLAGERADELLALVPAPTAEDIPTAISRLITISAFEAPARALTAAVAKAGCPAYLYHFTRVPALGPATRLGAFHGLEIPYVFALAEVLPGVDDTDRALSRMMSEAWVHFAATGDPNGGELPLWPRYSEDTEACMYFGDAPHVDRAPDLAACQIFDALPPDPADSSSCLNIRSSAA